MPTATAEVTKRCTVLNNHREIPELSLPRVSRLICRGYPRHRRPAARGAAGELPHAARATRVAATARGRRGGGATRALNGGRATAARAPQGEARSIFIMTSIPNVIV